MEYFCMVDFVRPHYLGTKKSFALMFERPIKKGQCIDSTAKDVKISRQRTFVLVQMVRGFIQRYRFKCMFNIFSLEEHNIYLKKFCQKVENMLYWYENLQFNMHYTEVL